MIVRISDGRQYRGPDPIAGFPNLSVQGDSMLNLQMMILAVSLGRRESSDPVCEGEGEDSSLQVRER